MNVGEVSGVPSGAHAVGGHRALRIGRRTVPRPAQPAAPPPAEDHVVGHAAGSPGDGNPRAGASAGPDHRGSRGHEGRVDIGVPAIIGGA